MSAATGITATDVSTPAGAAADAAEALRLLNHLTLAPPTAGTQGWEAVGDLCQVPGELRVLVDRLPQVCDQMVTGLHRLGERRDWWTDEGATEHPDEVVSTAVEALQEAGWVAEEVGLNLQHAHCAVAHLYQ
ncbi:MAG: hypothetical protein WBA45_01995 [Microthrixaceae bacterium]